MPRAVALSKVLKRALAFERVLPGGRHTGKAWGGGGGPREYLSPALRLMFPMTCEHTQLTAALQYMHMYVAEAKPSPPCLLCSPSRALGAYRQSTSPSRDFSLDSSQYTLLSLTKADQSSLSCPS